MMKLLLFTIYVLSELFELGLARFACEPFGVRLSFGEIFHDASSTEKLRIRFNTDQECLKSYVEIKENQNIIFKIYCSSETITINNQPSSQSNLDREVELQNVYTTTVHHCSIEDIKFENQFYYNVYGWDGIQPVFPYKNDFIQSKVMNPFEKNKQRKFIFLADWGKTYTKPYKPLQESFNRLIEQKVQIDGVIILGDIAYDLASNNCQNYEDFLIMSSQISEIWPIIYITGNHQHSSQNTNKLFRKSFSLYQLDTKLATTINLGSFNLLAFDPYFTVYQKKVKGMNLRGSSNKDIEEFRQQIAQLVNSEIPTIVGVHYPVICSSFLQNSCNEDRNILADFYDLMFEHKIGFYIGAHFHSYERNYPYFASNRTYLKLDPPYSPQQHRYLVNIVEGVAGNDKSIVEEYKQLRDSTAFHTTNTTGFGILNIQGQNFKYQHYSTENILTLQDSFDITLYPSKSFFIGKDLLQE